MKVSEFRSLIREEVRRIINEAEAPLYTDWEEHVNPDYIVVHLKDGRKLQISKKHIAGGSKVYQAILQAFNDERTDVTNKIVGAMSAMLGGTLKKEGIINEGTIMIFHYSKKPTEIDGDVKDLQNKAQEFIKTARDKNYNISSNDSALYFPNFTWAGGKQVFGPSLGVMAGSDTVLINPIGSTKMFKINEKLLVRFVKDGRIESYNLY